MPKIALRLEIEVFQNPPQKFLLLHSSDQNGSTGPMVKTEIMNCIYTNKVMILFFFSFFLAIRNENSSELSPFPCKFYSTLQ